MHKVYKNRNKMGFVEWSFLGFAVFLYPMLVSIYTLIPPLVGIAGLVIIYNINKNIIYTTAAMLYLINLDFNLALPFMLSIFSVVVIKILVYPTAKLLIRCRVCLALLMIIFIDGFYYINLFIYYFTVNANTVVADSMLCIYILFDIIIGLLL